MRVEIAASEGRRTPRCGELQVRCIVLQVVAIQRMLGSLGIIAPVDVGSILAGQRQAGPLWAKDQCLGHRTRGNMPVLVFLATRRKSSVEGIFSLQDTDAPQIT
jgi:hypothetical protein